MKVFQKSLSNVFQWKIVYTFYFLAHPIHVQSLLQIYVPRSISISAASSRKTNSIWYQKQEKKGKEHKRRGKRRNKYGRANSTWNASAYHNEETRPDCDKPDDRLMTGFTAWFSATWFIMKTRIKLQMLNYDYNNKDLWSFGYFPKLEHLNLSFTKNYEGCICNVNLMWN